MSNNRFIVLSLANQAAADTCALVARVRGRLASIADQVIRAAVSVPLNLAEGNGRSGNDRPYHFRVAYASAAEAAAGIDILLRIGAIDHAKACETLVLIDRVRAMTYRLLHG
jgi:four helix bundle protein